MLIEIPREVKLEAQKALQTRIDKGLGRYTNERGYQVARALSLQRFVTVKRYREIRAFLRRWRKKRNDSEIQKVNYSLWGGEPGYRWTETKR